MTLARVSKSAKVRSRLDHPIVDADGHIVELTPVLLEYVREIGGEGMAKRYMEAPSVRNGYHRKNLFRPPQELRDAWMSMAHWWSQPVDSYERATVSLPRLLSERLDDLGIDFTILYPSEGLFAPAIEEDEVRRVACRAYNTFAAGLVRDYADRMTAVAVIPMHTPQEAIEELEHAVRALGFKAVTLQGAVRRPISTVQREHPAAASLAGRMELFGLDSDYDYDPVWAKCVELKVAATFHGGVGALGVHSVSNYVYNHIGNLAGAHFRLCKALVLGGVTRRFPNLRFGFLEGGAAWACNLYADLVGHWDKRNAEAIRKLDPARLDQELMLRLVMQYGDRRTKDKAGEIGDFFAQPRPRPESLDDFAACGIRRAENLRDLFVSSIYVGCEADDPMNAMAFNRKALPFGAPLRIIFGSDIGHWDVPVMTEVVEEAYELVGKGALSERDFRDFTFTNPVRLHAGMNPDFFKGTRVEADAAKLLRQGV